MALEINSKNIKDVLDTDKLIVLDFWASWCGPCKMIAPIIDELATEFADDVVIGKVNTEDEDNDDLVADYSIRNLPTILFVKNGAVVDKMVGAAKKSDFVAKIEANK